MVVYIMICVHVYYLTSLSTCRMYLGIHLVRYIHVSYYQCISIKIYTCTTVLFSYIVKNDVRISCVHHGRCTCVQVSESKRTNRIFKNVWSNDNKVKYEGLKMKIKEAVWLTLAQSQSQARLSVCHGRSSIKAKGSWREKVSVV